MSSIESYIQQRQLNLSETDFMIAQYLVQNTSECSNISIKELANKLHISKSTILRFAQKIGFSGFTELKYYLKQELHEDKAVAEVDLLALQKVDIEGTQQFISDYDFAPLCLAIEQAKTVYLYGTGHSQRSALKELVKNLLLCRKQALLLPAQTEFDINMPLIQATDLVIIASLSGETKSIKNNIETLNLRGVPIVSVTSFSTNFLARHSDYRLYYHSTCLKPEENDCSVYSMLGVSIVLDAVYRSYMMRSNL